MNRQVHFGAHAIAALIIGLASVMPAQAASFSTTNVTDIVNYNVNSQTGSTEYLVRFSLDPQSDGLVPTSDPVLLSVGPDPDNPLAGQLPAFQVSIPGGCFVDTTGQAVRYGVDGTGCGVNVQLHDPLSSNDSSLNSHVSSFAATLIYRAGTLTGLLKVNLGFTGFNAPADTNPSGVLSLSIGNDNVQDLPLEGRVVTRGSQ